MSATDPAPEPFDPLPYVKKIRTRQGPQDYLLVAGRLAWFHHDRKTAIAAGEAPVTASIVTQLLAQDSAGAVVLATVTDWTGMVVTGHGEEAASDFGDFLMKAETKAIGRALANLGYGTDAVDMDDLEPEERPVPPAKPQAPAPARMPATRGPKAEAAPVPIEDMKRQVREACADIGISWPDQADPNSAWIARKVTEKTGIAIAVQQGKAKAGEILGAIAQYRGLVVE